MNLQIKRLSDSSWFKIKADDKIIYVDPGYPGETPTVGFEEKGDIILVTHDHYDHLNLDILSHIRSADTVVVAPALAGEKIGGNVKIVKPGDGLSFNGIEIKVFPAYNMPGGSSTVKPHTRANSVSYLISIGNKNFYHAGDTDFIPEMNSLGRVDVALLPIGGKYTMDLDEAVRAAMAINPVVAIPMHCLKADPEEFKRMLEEKSEVRVIVLKTGEDYEIE